MSAEDANRKKKILHHHLLHYEGIIELLICYVFVPGKSMDMENPVKDCLDVVCSSQS